MTAVMSHSDVHAHVPRRGSPRWKVAVASIAVTVVVIGITLFHFLQAPSLEVLESLPFNDQTLAAAQLQASQSDSIFQLLLLLAAGLLGVFLAPHTETRITLADTPEIVMSLLGTAMIVVSGVFHFKYIREIHSALATSGMVETNQMPDVLGEAVSYLFTGQFVFFLGGCLIVGMALWSTYRLKGTEQ